MIHLNGPSKGFQAAVALVVLSPMLCLAQAPAAAAPAVAAPAQAASTQDRQGEKVSYIIGAGDLISIHASNVPELTDKPVRIDMNGYINLPMAGKVQAAGLTVEALEAAVSTRLKVYLEQPDVTISVTEYQSQPVSVFGEVSSPGVHQLQGRKTLVEILALAGGVRADAGPTVRITRRLEYGKIPLPGAVEDPSGKFSIASLDLKPLIQAKTPERDIEIQPYDIVSVPKAELIYIAGDVTKSGPLALQEKSTMSIMEALSSTGGVTRTADTKRARILRAVPGNAKREQVPVDIASIMKGKIDDVQLVPGDILVVPSSGTKKASQRALDAAIQVATVVLSTSVVTGAL
ncbi:MAG TPA: polysaccharide biosynthesis/export family protein [Bryobacteraceae bacterium]|jgi:polysaccharide export outer membrane protein|nr:polysaccharide biosynthesis/export family protein [Bryobacteraceae bacterium]